MRQASLVLSHAMSTCNYIYIYICDVLSIAHAGEERGGDAADNFAEETYWDGQGDEDWAGTDECWADGAAWYDNAGTEVCSDWGPGHVNGETGEGSSSWDPETEWEGTPKPGPVKRSVSWSDDVGRPLKMTMKAPS